MNNKSRLKLGTQKLNLNPLSNNCIFTLFAFILLTNCSGTKPALIGQFSPCPEKPNCVSSKSSLSLHKIKPIYYKGTPEDAKTKILEIIKSMPRTKIFMTTKNFIHVEFTSKLFRFVDDAEFYFENLGIIHFRSASRIGYSDMGVNRERLEKIRQRFIDKG